jgi:hypothetical protein
MISEAQWWLIFSLIAAVVVVFAVQVLSMPYWSKEPVMQKWNWLRKLVQSPWKRGLSEHKLVCKDVRSVMDEYDGVGLRNKEVDIYGRFSAHLIENWRGAVDRVEGTGASGGGGGIGGLAAASSGMKWKFEGENRRMKCLLGLDGVGVSWYPIVDISDPGMDLSRDAGDEGKPGDAGGREHEVGWLLSVPGLYRYHRRGVFGGLLADIFGGGWEEGIVHFVPWMSSRPSASPIYLRGLFTTHMYRRIFYTEGKGDCALFCASPESMAMGGVLPVVRYRVFEFVLDESKIWPSSVRRGPSSVNRWVRIFKNVDMDTELDVELDGDVGIKTGADMRTMSVERAWMNWMRKLAGKDDVGALPDVRMYCVMSVAQMTAELKSGSLLIWAWMEDSRADDGELEIKGVVCFRDTGIRGCRESGSGQAVEEVFELCGLWYAIGVSVEEGGTRFVHALKELKRSNKNAARLIIPELGYGFGLLKWLGVKDSAAAGLGGGSGSGIGNGKIGNITRDPVWKAYYFYNRFYDEIPAKTAFILL